MANEMMTTVIGNLTADPELRFTPSGDAVCNFDIASTSRRFNSLTNQWEDNEPVFMRCSLWRQAGENAAESLSRGSRVIAYGRLEQRNWEDKEKNKRSRIEMTVLEIGPSLTFGITKFVKVTREEAAPEEPETASAPAARTTRTRPARQRS